MDRGLLALSTDVLQLIWNYLELSDIARFGLTAKKMLDATWPFCKEVLMDDEQESIESLFFVLSRDLSRVRNLELCYLSASLDKDGLMPKIAALASSKLSNLQRLKICIDTLNYLSDEDRDVLTSIENLIVANTQLQSLVWREAEIEKISSIGQFLSAHTRLTSLSISTLTIHGIRDLTQLKRLDLKCYFDENLSEVLDLTQLKVLNLDSYHNEDFNILDSDFTNMSNLTNLEQFKMVKPEGGSTTLIGLSNLPRLCSLTLRFPTYINNREYSETIGRVGRLDKLTRLKITNFKGQLDTSLIKGLTNLQSLEMNTKVVNADFLLFKNLTSLAIRAKKKKIKIANLPPNLRSLNIQPAKLSKHNIETICNLKYLRNLHMQYCEFDPVLLARRITRLTRLTDLTILPAPPIELISAIRTLPNLTCLICDEISEELEWEASH